MESCMEFELPAVGFKPIPHPSTQQETSCLSFQQWDLNFSKKSIEKGLLLV